jgi:hypothetical protein
MKLAQSICGIGLLGLSTALASCRYTATSGSAAAMVIADSFAIYDIPLTPESTLTVVLNALPASPLHLQISSVDHLTLETAFESYTGQRQGVLLWQKNWQERSKYFIEIGYVSGSPPRSRVHVLSYSQQRPNDSYPWREVASNHAATRKEEIVQLLVSILRGGAR